MDSIYLSGLNHIKKGIALMLLLVGLSISLPGQGYKIKVSIKGYKNDTLLLGYHYGDKQYIKDTAFRLNGQFVFEKDTLLEPGMYLIVLKPSHDFFQLLIEEKNQQFSVETSLDLKTWFIRDLNLMSPF
jgi:hypothetical protein